MFRAIVEQVSDDQKRYRHKVRILNLHAEDLSVAALPEAELCALFSSKQAGDIPHYEKGDTVWVVLENNDPSKPVIVGGWITNSGGIPDVPLTQIEGYKTSRRRWNRVDRQGNSLELSELGTENWARLESGNAQVTVSQNGNTVQLKSSAGPVEVLSKVMSVVVKQATFSTDSMSFDAFAVVGGTPAGDMALKSNNKAVLYGALTTRLGFHVPTVQGIPIGTARQGVTVAVAPTGSLKLGTITGDLDSETGVPLLPCATLEAHGVVISIIADTSVRMLGPVVTVEGTGSLVLRAPSVTIDGDLTCTGSVTATGALVAATVRQLSPPVTLGTHIHTGDGQANPPGPTSVPIPAP